jgi:tRNA/rRNA methyltransferase
MTDETLAPVLPKRLELATHDESEGFYLHLEQKLIETGFLDPTQPKRLMSRLRRLFTRAGLQKEEVNILRGMLNTFSRRP